MDKKNSNRSNLVILTKKNYLKSIANSTGSNLFRNLYVVVEGHKKDITKNGELSCALFVSSILYLYRMIREIHATVNGTVKDLENLDWHLVDKPKIGSVLVWEGIDFGDGDIHEHIGFYIGDNQAVSNSNIIGQPVSHHWLYGSENKSAVRKVEKILWHQYLDKETW